VGIPAVIAVGISVASGVATIWNWFANRKKKNQKKDDAEETPQVAPELPVPNEVIIAVAHLRAHHATAAEIQAAADKAEAAGHCSLALALRNESAVLAAAEKFAAELGHDVPAEPLRFKSPFDSVGDEQWTKYVKQSRTHRSNSVSDNFKLGTYQLSARDLADAEFMISAKKVDEEGHSVWIGEWAPGYSLEDFLASSEIQYNAFLALSRLHASRISKKYSKVIGTTIESQQVTLSGLLAVAKKAGQGGLESWLKSAKERSKFRDTTERYLKFNGMF
jgi:hypothetical protein